VVIILSDFYKLNKLNFHKTPCTVSYEGGSNLLSWPFLNKNLAIANISRISCAHNTSTASLVTQRPWNLG